MRLVTRTQTGPDMNPTIPDLCETVGGQAMMRHLEEFARRVKLSGSPDELESFEHLRSQLDGYGFPTEPMLHDAYISSEQICGAPEHGHLVETVR